MIRSESDAKYAPQEHPCHVGQRRQNQGPVEASHATVLFFDFHVDTIGETNLQNGTRTKLANRVLALSATIYVTTSFTV